MLALVVRTSIWFLGGLWLISRVLSRVGGGPRRHRTLPRRIIAAYSTTCGPEVERTLSQGANVIIWFSSNLELRDGAPTMGGSITLGTQPNLTCISDMVRRYPDVIYLLSIGGWNAPLPDTSISGARWFRTWRDWNGEMARRYRWRGFDGMEWDLEGHDDPRVNIFTTTHLDLMGSFSRAAHIAGFFVSMAPSQSYLDVAEDGFDTAVALAPHWRPNFHYHGKNLYAYVLAFHGVETFDWVSVQFYEGWSRANYHLSIRGDDAPMYFRNLVSDMDHGWEIDFGQRGKRVVRVPRDKLMFGLANAWTSPYPPPHKFLLITPRVLQQACDAVTPIHRGFMFWNIGEEGKPVDGVPFFLTRELSTILARY